MKIELIRTVKHGGHTYRKGDVITADEGLGKYFCSCGWAREVGSTVHAEASTAEVTLDVQSAKHVTKSEHRNG